MKTQVTSTFEQTTFCMRCALCQTVCPVFHEYQSELTSPRSKVRLIWEYAEGNLALTPRLKELICHCLGCQRCSGYCPAKIPIHELIQLVKAEFANQGGFETGEKLLLRYVLGNRNWMLESFFRMFRHMWHLPGSKEQFLPQKLNGFLELVPELPKMTFYDDYQRSERAKAKKGGKKVGYYVGCLTDYLFPQVPQAAVYLLEKHGYQVVFPPKLRCCGTPQWESGDVAGAKALSYKNMEAFQETGVDVILTDCGSCNSALKRYGKIYQQELRTLDFISFSEKITDVVLFLFQEGIKTGAMPLNKKITYHDSCHMAQDLKITAEPRQMLNGLPGANYQEMVEPDRCCGGGGSFMVKHPETSKLILKRKLNNIWDTKAEVLVTSCPSCRIHLSAGLRKSDLELPVVHPVELIARSHGWSGIDSISP